MCYLNFYNWNNILGYHNFYRKSILKWQKNIFIFHKRKYSIVKTKTTKLHYSKI